MPCSLHLSRRTLFRALFGGLCAPLGLTPAPVPGISAMLRGIPRSSFFWRRYRVDATVLLCGVPLFTKRNVGGAFASVEAGSIGGSSVVALQFAGGSSPEHARGLNRFGIWREVIVARSAEPSEIAFAGLMTDSHEQTLAEGRSALSRANATEVLVSTGTVNGNIMRTWTYRAPVAHDCTWSGLPQILGDITAQAPPVAPREVLLQESPTFLYAIRKAALASQDELRQPFLHAGKLYQLQTRRSLEHPLVISAVIHDPTGARSADFRLAFAANDESGLPVRIEYRAKSFLRLTLEFEPDATQPPVPSVFEESV